MKVRLMRAAVQLVVCALLVAAAAATAGPVFAQTINNGDFSQGLTGWVPFIADPPGPANTISVVPDETNNPVLQMSVNALDQGGVGWHVQTWQPDGGLDSLASSTVYTLSFRAKASVVRTMQIDLYQWEYDPPVPYRYLGLRVWPTIGTGWQSYSINFRTEDNMPNFPDAKVKLAFAVGHALGTVWIDDIQLGVTPTKTFSVGTILPLFTFEPGESWLTGNIQNSPTPPDVVTPDTTHVHAGTSALKLSTGASGRAYAERQAPLDLSVDNWEMTFWAYVDNPANVANVSIALRSGSESQLALKWWTQTGLAAGWNQVVIPKAQFWGVYWREQMTWSAARVVGVKLETNDNGPASVWIDDLQVEPAAGDRRPPVIGTANLESLSPTAVTVGWRTDESATGRLECGTTTSYGTSSFSGALSTSHSLSVSGLAANTLYHCQVSSDDSGARTGRSGDFVFRTDPAAPWVPADPQARFQVGLFGVNGWDETGLFTLASLDEPFLARFPRFYQADQTWETDAQILQYLDAMQAHGRSAFVNIDRPAILSGDTATIQARVNAIKSHPALAGWYLFDEPEFYSVTQQQLETAYQAIKAVDALHPVTFAAPGFAPGYTFLNAMDYGILDPYPIPNAPPSDILTNLANARATGKAF
ncbi:MAG TPA: fibronectin type III domain-containing protein, partial [Gemmatimonadales bacterium]|nr:fibronectin type III domain-containing protein [Gemmatimonadales bacterium]